MKRCPEAMQERCVLEEGHAEPHSNPTDGEFTLFHQLPPDHDHESFRKVTEFGFIAYDDAEPHYIGVTFISEHEGQKYVTKFSWTDKGSLDMFIAGLVKMREHLWPEASN